LGSNKTRNAHDPEKWIPVFGKDHAPLKRLRAGDWFVELERQNFDVKD
jgi:hypothetical protein